MIMKYQDQVNIIGVMEKFIKVNGKGETVWNDNKRYNGDYLDD